MRFTKELAPNCDKCPDKLNCLFAFLNRLAQRSWKDLRKAGEFHDGELIFNEGEKPAGLFIVCSGRVKLCKTSPSGQQLISRIEQAGDLLGHITLFAGGNFQYSGEAMGKTVVSFIDHGLFIEQFIKKHPEAALAIMQALAKDVVSGDSKATDIAYKSAKSRMADVILKAAITSGRKIMVKDVKRRELAEIAGLTVETAVRILAELEKKKIIKRQGKEIWITKKDKLQEVAKTNGEK